MRPYTPDDAARAAELDAREARPASAVMSDLTPLARLIEDCTQRSMTWEETAEALVADPDLLDALAAAGVLREERVSGSRAPDGSLVDERVRMPDGRRYVTPWQETSHDPR